MHLASVSASIAYFVAGRYLVFGLSEPQLFTISG